MRLPVLVMKALSYDGIIIYQYGSHHWVGSCMACAHLGQLQAAVHIFFVYSQAAKISIKK
jgi:hypothetical protein